MNGAQSDVADIGGSEEVEIAVPGEQLPFAASAVVEIDDTPVEIQVESVVDFGVYSADSMTAAVMINDLNGTHIDEGYHRESMNTSNLMRTPFADDDTRSEVSANWAEDSKVPDTPEEIQVCVNF